MIAVLDCTCRLRVEVAGYCPLHEPDPCPVYSRDADGWHCAVTGDHDQHRNAAGTVTCGAPEPAPQEPNA